jgi:Rv0078B-related antitoxin
MHEAGREMARLRLRREHPDWTHSQVNEALARWLASAPLGPGRPVSDERWSRITGTSR